MTPPPPPEERGAQAIIEWLGASNLQPRDQAKIKEAVRNACNEATLIALDMHATARIDMLRVKLARSVDMLREVQKFLRHDYDCQALRFINGYCSCGLHIFFRQVRGMLDE